MPRPPNKDDHEPAPITNAEQERIGLLLASIGTQTLLHTLTGLGRDSQDARLIIAALMDRLPPDGRG